MAGVTDRAFRRLCTRLGAAMAVSEMVTSDARLRATRKSRLRSEVRGEAEPRAVQIAGAVPARLADAARYHADNGAQIIDINMGCPAKKVCNVHAGSALLADEILVGDILRAVVAAAGTPVTLKIRTGPAPERRNGLHIARIAESEGIAALAVHGRTRACGFRGEAEYGTIARIKAAVSIPVIANGDIASPRDARRVLDATGADGLMIGRAAQGNPWIFREIDHYLRTGTPMAPPGPAEVGATLLGHLAALYRLYGADTGVRVARKHLSWYCKGRPGAAAFWQRINRVESPRAQLAMTRDYFASLCDTWQRAA